MVLEINQEASPRTETGSFKDRNQNVLQYVKELKGAALESFRQGDFKSGLEKIREIEGVFEANPSVGKCGDCIRDVLHRIQKDRKIGLEIASAKKIFAGSGRDVEKLVSVMMKYETSKTKILDNFYSKLNNIVKKELTKKLTSGKIEEAYACIKSYEEVLLKGKREGGIRINKILTDIIQSKEMTNAVKSMLSASKYENVEKLLLLMQKYNVSTEKLVGQSAQVLIKSFLSCIKSGNLVEAKNLLVIAKNNKFPLHDMFFEKSKKEERLQHDLIAEASNLIRNGQVDKLRTFIESELKSV